MAKKKTIVDKKASDTKKVFRIPTAPSTTWHKDKSKYNRKKKHKKDYHED